MRVLPFPLTPDFQRPLPPDDLTSFSLGQVVPALELIDWAHRVFLSGAGPLTNADHLHLHDATLGFAWCSKPYTRKGRGVAGLCEMPQEARGHGWAQARSDDQLTRWFGAVPDFLITLEVGFCRNASDAQFCALVEHELYHASFKRDEFGAPKFNQEGGYTFAIQGHDVEEFVGVVRRYGVVSDEVRQLLEAAQQRPELGDLDIRHACGTCQRRAA